MKKRVWFLTIGLCIMLLAAGCGKKETANEQDSTDTKTTEDAADKITDKATTGETADEEPVKEDYKASDYITLGNYKGIEVTYEKLEVKDEDVDNRIKSDLEGNATQEEVKGRAVQDGDIVNIDFEGLKDGVAFEGGTAKDFDLTIGSGQFLEGFEEGLIGKNAGDKVSLDLTFPKEYQDAKLAGQPVVFKVTINSIKKSVVPELTEAFVKDKTDYDTIDAYKAGIRKELEESNAEQMKGEKTDSAISQIIESSKISSYPKSLTEYYSYQIKNSYTQYATMYGMEFADFLSAMGLNEDSFAEKVKTDAEKQAATEMVLKAIIEAEKLELTDKEYEEGLAGYVEKYQFASKEELLKTASEEAVKDNLLFDKAINLVLEQAVEK